MQALLVIDMLNGFCRSAGSSGTKHALYCGPAAEAAVASVRDAILERNRAPDPVIFTCDAHAPDDPEFAVWPPHCIRGTEEARIVDELAGLARRAIVIPKTTYSSFFRTNLERTLADLAPDLVEVCGVCTNICVLSAVLDLRLRGYRTLVRRDRVASFDRAAHDFALSQMKEVFGAEVA